MSVYSLDLVQQIARRNAEEIMTATVRIVRPDTPGLDEDGSLEATELLEVYGGKARVFTVSGPVTMQLGDEPEFFSSTYVTIPLEVDNVPSDPRVNDLVHVEAHPDRLMVDRVFRVIDVQAGSLIPHSRTLSVSGVQASKQWKDPESIPAEWIIE